jgi:MFS transporter, DHA1 family, tetracycline resistance protein
MGLISQNIGAHEQGAILGVAQSTNSLARILGPILGGFMFDQVGHSSPFIAASILVVLTVVAGSKFLLTPSTKFSKIIP